MENLNSEMDSENKSEAPEINDALRFSSLLDEGEKQMLQSATEKSFSRNQRNTIFIAEKVRLKINFKKVVVKPILIQKKKKGNSR